MIFINDWWAFEVDDHRVEEAFSMIEHIDWENWNSPLCERLAALRVIFSMFQTMVNNIKKNHNPHPEALE